MDGLNNWKIKFKEYMVSEVTHEVLSELIERKQKEKRFEQLVLKWSLSLFVVIFFGVLYVIFYKLPLFQTTYTTGNSLVNIVVGDKLLLILIVVGLLCCVQMIHNKKKQDKSETEYEELRIATIERGEELWEKPVPWKNRHEVFEWLKTEYDINLYHK